ncbi:unnamed protein product [Gemmata massiliana]|uniref:Uncharacterized protein n=1 Tax=Gemmata massiliana TaxID=1210884 RepID=A0A6P2D0Z8_9BACT|nr:unnamed protein product [Gemmata massiliana]
MNVDRVVEVRGRSSIGGVYKDVNFVDAVRLKACTRNYKSEAPRAV